MEGGWQGSGLRMLPRPSAELSFPRDRNGREGVPSSEMDRPELELRHNGLCTRGCRWPPCVGVASGHSQAFSGSLPL